jgi:hypothetical protein
MTTGALTAWYSALPDDYGFYLPCDGIDSDSQPDEQKVAIRDKATPQEVSRHHIGHTEQGNPAVINPCRAC